MNERKRRPEDEFLAGAVEYWESKTGRKRDDYPKESLDDEGRRKRPERIWEARRESAPGRWRPGAGAIWKPASGRCSCLPLAKINELHVF